LYELTWQGVETVRGWDLIANATPPAPLATGDPKAYYFPLTNTKHVIYLDSGGHIHDLAWSPRSNTPQHEDLTTRFRLPIAFYVGEAFTLEGPNTQHVVFVAHIPVPNHPGTGSIDGLDCDDLLNKEARCTKCH
jgi:hypothetical protein